MKKIAIIDRYIEQIVSYLGDTQPGTEEYEQKISDLEENFLPEYPKGSYKREMIRQVGYKSHKNIENPSILIKLYQYEVDFLCKVGQKNRIKELFYSVIIYEKLHPHESGWIKFDIDELADIAFYGNSKRDIRQEDFYPLVQYGLDMRVVGSKEAIPCYKLPDMFDENKQDVVYEFEYSKEQNAEILKKVMLL